MNEKPVPFVILISKGILRDRQMRRTALFWIVLASLTLLGAGAFLLDGWLSEHLIAFILYWGACLWLTMTSILLALYDLLAIRNEAARKRRQIKGQVLGGNEGDQP